MMNSEHPHTFEIQEMIDGRLEERRARDVRAHCDLCDDCARLRDSLSALDAGLRGLPLEQTGPAFTSTLMNTLGLAQGAKAQSRLFEFFAFAFGLLIVLAAVGSAFLFAGGGAESTLDPATQQIVGSASSALESGIGAIARWIPIGNLLGGSAVRTIVFAILAIGLAGLADRLVRRRLVGG